MQNKGLIVSVFTVLYDGKKYIFSEPCEGKYTFDDEGYPVVLGIPFSEWKENGVNCAKE